MRSDGEWLTTGKWGLFAHYLADRASARAPVELAVEAWNERLDAFDVNRLAEDLDRTGAAWFGLTLGQNSGFYLAPNATYDSYVPRRPSRLSRRDLIADLIAALRPRGIRVMVYLPSHAPALDRVAVEGLRCTPTWDASCWQLRPGSYVAEEPVDDRLSEFQRRWEAVIAEWSRRWGDGVAAWWFDGCYRAERMYRHPDEPNFASFAAAARAGNPAALVAFNPGIKVPVVRHSEHEDYTAGEVADCFPLPTRHRPLEPLVDGARLHLLSFLGDYWGQGEPRFPDEFVIGYTRLLNDAGGAITWDLPLEISGALPAAYRDQLAALRRATR